MSNIRSSKCLSCGYDWYDYKGKPTRKCPECGALVNIGIKDITVKK